MALPRNYFKKRKLHFEALYSPPLEGSGEAKNKMAYDPGNEILFHNAVGENTNSGGRNYFKELKLHFEVLYPLSFGEGRGEVNKQTFKNY